MAAFIRKLKVTNQNGFMNAGDWGNIQNLRVSKTYSGSGGDSEGEIVNGRRTDADGAANRMGQRISGEDSGFSPRQNR